MIRRVESGQTGKTPEPSHTGKTGESEGRSYTPTAGSLGVSIKTMTEAKSMKDRSVQYPPTQVPADAKHAAGFSKSFFSED